MLVRRDLGEEILGSPLALLKLRVEAIKSRQGTDITVEAECRMVGSRAFPTAKRNREGQGGFLPSLPRASCHRYTGKAGQV